jgi:hypothetical protein
MRLEGSLSNRIHRKRPENHLGTQDSEFVCSRELEHCYSSYNSPCAGSISSQDAMFLSTPSASRPAARPCSKEFEPESPLERLAEKAWDRAFDRAPESVSMEAAASGKSVKSLSGQFDELSRGFDELRGSPSPTPLHALQTPSKSPAQSQEESKERQQGTRFRGTTGLDMILSPTPPSSSSRPTSTLAFNLARVRLRDLLVLLDGYAPLESSSYRRHIVIPY